MLSDYFAQSDAKLETQKPPKYSVYYQTNKIVTNRDMRKDRLSSGGGNQSRGGKAFKKIDE